MVMSRKLYWIIFVLVFSIISASPSSAVWEFESENRPSGISSYATTFWLEGQGAISLDDLVQIEDEIEEGTYWATLTVSCVKKKLLIGVNLNMAGSANQDIVLDDPGYAYLRFDTSSQRKYRTYGSDIQSSINFSSEARVISTNLMKAGKLTLTVRDRIARERITMVFDVSGFAKAKSRFRYAGCKL